MVFKSTHFSMSRILSLVRSERSVTLLMLLRAAYSSEKDWLKLIFFVVIICMIRSNFTCEADQKVGAKELCKSTGADGENF